MKKLRQKDINFFEASRNSGAVQSVKKKNRKKVLVILFPLILLTVCASIWSVAFWDYLEVYAEVTDATVYTAALVTDADYQLAQEVEAQVAQLKADTENLRRVRQAIDSFPSLSKEFFDTLTTAGNGKVKLLSYSYSSASGALGLSGQASGISETALFVARLRVSGLFSSLGYTGYMEADADGASTTDGEEVAGAAAGAKTYVFQITGILRGKEVTADGNEASDQA